jgi:endonuclease/exonuclease/phosphatase family metal-dependent hydrolase
MARGEADFRFVESSGSTRVRAMTMNVFSPSNPDWRRRRALLAETFRSLQADVLALQEVPVDAQAVADLIGSGYHLTAHSETSDDGVGAVLATRWPHRRVTEIDLRISDRTSKALPWCATVVVEMECPLGTLIVAHHKPTWPFPFELERETQAVIVARALEDHIGSRDAHALVLGDFDATPDSASMQFWRGRRAADGFSVCYQDAWEYAHPGDPGYTFDTANPLVRAGEVSTAVSRKIDHILVRSGWHGPTLKVVDCRRVLDRPVKDVWASDHYGVMADLVVPEGNFASG